MKATCENCRWWAKDGDWSGLCRISAPIVMQVGSRDYSYEPATCWPRVKPYDFCGEFEVKERKDENSGSDGLVE